jgi:phage-related holin
MILVHVVVVKKIKSVVKNSSVRDLSFKNTNARENKKERR